MGTSVGHCWAFSYSNKTPRASCWSPGGGWPSLYESTARWLLQPQLELLGHRLAYGWLLRDPLFLWSRPIQTTTSSQPLPSSLPTPDHPGGGGHTSSAALLMGRVRRSSVKSEPTEGRHWEVTKLRKIVVGRVWARAPELSSLRCFRETARLLHLLMFRKLMGTGLFLSARGRLLFFLNQPGLNWTGWVNTVSSQALEGSASQLSSTASGPASPPSALLAVSIPRSLPRGSALSAPGSSSQKPGLAPGWPPPGPSLPAVLPVGPKASPTAWLLPGCLGFVLPPVSILSAVTMLLGTGLPNMPAPGTQAPAVCLPLAAVPRDPPPTSWAVLWSASRLR